MTPVDLPTASQRPRRTSRWPWLIPIIAVGFAGWLAYDAWSRSGVVVNVSLPAGYGLRIGDEVRFRGIAVGTVEAIDLADGLDGVVVQARLHSQGDRLARNGARFWVVRPEVGLGGVVGLETIVGPRYLAISPGEGGPQRYFVGLADPPIVESIEPGDLEVIVEAPRQSGVRPGGPVLYRQVRIGTVLSVGLTTDGSAVEARVHIEKAYAQLIHPESKFWNGGGLEARVGLRGVTVDVESIEALIGGGIGVATPPVASAPVRTGHRFPLHGKAEKEWLEWTPLVVIGSPFLPPGAVMPS
ncbi:MAG: MCE family protein, partial [Phycisphaerales bacterium]|nr:MCE family protein [Phycisphaerales bacterium]